MATVKPSSYYSSDGDIAYISVRSARGPVRTERDEWRLLDYDRETGELVGIEVWKASTVLPTELVEALPRLDGRRTVLDRSELAKPQPA